MVKVFILGASGFIGFAVALALRRNGHRVYGLVRDAGKGLNLAKHEITPIIGDILQPSSWTFVVESEGIDVIIDLSNVAQDSGKILTEVKRLGEARLQGLKRGPKLGFILFSGTWVHGDQPDARDIVNELTTPTPLDMVAWRPATENQVLGSSDVLDAVVIRPTMLYGGSGSIFSMLLAPIAAGVKEGASEAKVLGRKFELAVIHKDDVADFTLRVVEKISYVGALSYPLFDIAAQHESYTDIIEAAAKYMGFTGAIVYRDPEGPMAMFEQAILTQFNTSSDRARTYLGWEPRHRDIMGQIDIYTAAMVANQ
ncbi:NAD(P)-binding protein [Tuber magnatum]|uniref:NAD(P)-binding protein n=1 Tax=Tuber magnatum TaxID=42249 RepID=A0A317SGX6_9PEZI|nr:NAD(P)-binding protein [Tuber magnatum]